MSENPTRQPFGLLAAIAFGPPMCVLSMFLVPSFVFALADSRATSWVPAQWPDLVALILLVMVPVAAAIAFSRFASRTPALAARAGSLYVGLNVVAFAIAFIVSASIAGTSMAVAEGASSGWMLKAQEIRSALGLLIPMQLVVIPWAAFCTLTSIRLRRSAPTAPTSGAWGP